MPSPSSPPAPKWAWGLAFLGLLWMLPALSPQGPVECDSQQISVWAEQVARHGRGSNAHDLSYNYVGTPGTHLVLAGLRALLPVDALTLYGALGVLAGLTAWVLGAALAARLAGVAWPWAALALLTFQETLGGTAYPSSNMLAMVPLLASCLVALAHRTDRGALAAGALAGVAGWLRADAVLMVPILPLLLWDGGPVGPWLRRVAWLALGGTVVGLGAIVASGSGPLAIVHHARKVLKPDEAPLTMAQWLISQSGMAHVAFFGAVHGLLLPLGLVRLAAQKSWQVLAIVVVGTLPAVVVLGAHLTTPKGYLYLLPLLATAVLVAGKWLVEPTGGPLRKSLAALAMLLLVGQGVVGVRVKLAAKPWAAEPGPTWLTLFQQERSGAVSRVAVVIGAGTVLPTDDGPRLASGLWFAPAHWHAFKQQRVRIAETIRAYVRNPEAPFHRLFAGTCDGVTEGAWSLTLAGYKTVGAKPIRAPGRRMIWGRDGHTIEFVDSAAPDYSVAWYEPGGPGLWVYGSGREQTRLKAQGVVQREITGNTDLVPLGLWQVRLPDVPETKR